MEDVLKFLVVAAVVVIGIVKQYKKETGKKTVPPPADGMPDPYNGEPAETDIPPRPAAKAEPFIPHPRQEAPKRRPQWQEGMRTTATVPPPAIDETAGDTPGDEYAIRSAEEARKAIVWGEIMKRKYE